MQFLFTVRYFRNYFIAGILLSIIISPVDAQAYKVRMAFIGNSITYGSRLDNPATECYPAQLGGMLSEIYGDTVEIRNAGVSGRTMLKNAESPIWDESAFKSAIKFVPDICLILLGTNDSKPYLWDSLGNEFLPDYLDMIDTFMYRNPNTRFIVCYPPPIWEGHPYGTDFSDSHNDSIVVNHIIPLIDSVVEKTGAILVDFHTPFVDSLQLFPDKLHPNIDGHRQMAEILYKLIEEEDLIHQVDAGLAYVSDFYQVKSPVVPGSTVQLKWTTIFADSAFLDGAPVDPAGSAEVVAEDRVYTLTAKGSRNMSDFNLKLETYVPEKSGLKINIVSYDYRKGKPVTLYAEYLDQEGKEMTENTSNVTWTITEGEGEFGEQTDTSIVFIPVAVGKTVILASEGDLSDDISLTINSMSTGVNDKEAEHILVYPNPVQDRLHFELGNLPDPQIQVRVFDLTGRLIIEKDYDITNKGVSNIELNTTDLKSGIYIYGIYSGESVRFGRFTR